MRVWNSFPEPIKEHTHFILVDDGSPHPIEPREFDFNLNLTMVRILHDIPWNQPGARNLGAHLAETEYLFFTDIDHEITVKALSEAIHTQKNHRTLYMFHRIFNGVPHSSHPCSFVISKAVFDTLGGFDEDFSGYRGHDDTMFLLNADRYLRRKILSGTLILHGSALTEKLDRDHKRNTELIEHKKKLLRTNNYKNGERLRFDWEITHVMKIKSGLAHPSAEQLKMGNPETVKCLGHHSNRTDAAAEGNPMWDLAAKAYGYEKRGCWRQAIDWYQRALTCFPNLFGNDDMVVPKALGENLSIAFTPQHASRLYAALGRCFNALGENVDGALAYEAAHKLDDTNLEARRFLESQPCMDSPPCPLEADSDRPAFPASHTTLKSHLTLILTTHCTKTLAKFSALAPPSAKLITTTYGSMLEIFGQGLHDCQKFLCYDLNPEGDQTDQAYTESIQGFVNQHGFELHSYPGIGLLKMLNQIINHVSTPYLFFVEHDWMFKGGHISLPSIISMMDADASIHSIRFNKRFNGINGFDFIMRRDDAHRSHSLLRTSSYSNNPSIIRTKMLKEKWLPLCTRTVAKEGQEPRASAWGIEEILFKKHVQDIRVHGFDAAHKDWGAYVFGKLGDNPRVVHIGE
jgi:tetratricopeptide (TPR) repeat protein